MSDWIELKDLQAVAKAQAEGWDVEVYYHETDHWVTWHGNIWCGVAKYRGRPSQPKMKKVKSICWRGMTEGGLYWTNPERTCVPNYQRFPAGDIEGEVEDDS